MSKQKVLLHLCCGPCGTWSIERLTREYEVILYWSDSNIWPKDEHDKRLEYAKEVAYFYKLELHIDLYNHKSWLEHIAGFEKEPEGQKRCTKCFEFNFHRSATFAKANDIEFFTTSLSISPYKNNDIINEVGKEVATAHGLSFLEFDFGKEDGYRKSIQRSKELGLYRQKYCGCEFSKR